MKHTLLAILVLILSLIFPLTASADDIKPFVLGGIDQVNPEGAVITEGYNIFHTNSARGMVYFPFSEKFSLKVGVTEGQPVIVSDYCFVEAGNNITAIKLSTGSILCTYPVESKLDNSLYIIADDYGSYRLLAVSGSSIKCIKYTDSDGPKMSTVWKYDIPGGEDISPKSVTLSDNLGNALAIQYVNFATKDGKLYALILSDGQPINPGLPINHGIITSGGSMDGNAPVIYYSRPTDHVFYLSEIAVPANTSGKGFIQGSIMMNGAQQDEIGLNKNMIIKGVSGGLGGYTSITYLQDFVRGGSRPCMLMEEGKGIIVGYDLDSGETLFRITKYNGNKVVNYSIKGTTALVAFANGSILGFDLNRAVSVGQDNDNQGYTADSSIAFEGSLNGPTTSGITSFSVVDSSQDSFGNIRYTTYREVFLAADRSTDPSKPNLQMFYADKYDYGTKKPIPVPGSFTMSGKAVSGICVPGGVSSKISFAGGYMVLVDGYGYLHGFGAGKTDNISLVNFTNDGGNSITKGNTYKCTVDLVNFSGKYINDAPCKFTIFNDKGIQLYTRTDKFSFGPDGCSIFLLYQSPQNLDTKYITIRAEINNESTKVLSESDYSDNIAEIKLDVHDDLDLYVDNISYDTYPANSRVIAIVSVRNTSDMVLTNPLVPVTFSINYNGQVITKSKEVAMPAKGSVQVLFNFTTPDLDTSFQVTGSVNTGQVFKEQNMSNNSKTITVRVMKNAASTVQSDDNINRITITRQTGTTTVNQ